MSRIARVLLVLAALALLAPPSADAQARKKKKARPVAEESDESEKPDRPEKPEPKGDRPFKEQGYLQVPADHDLRMGDPSGALTIMARRGSLIRRNKKALDLEKGRMGVSMKAGGMAAVRVMSGTLIAETAGGTLLLDRGEDATTLSVIEGKVLVNVGQKARTLYTGQSLTLDGDGKVKTGSVPAETKKAARAWLNVK